MRPPASKTLKKQVQGRGDLVVAGFQVGDRCRKFALGDCQQKMGRHHGALPVQVEGRMQPPNRFRRRCRHEEGNNDAGVEVIYDVGLNIQ